MDSLSNVTNLADAEVTVIVPTYNQKKYLRKCLDSIISQKTDFKFAILVHDDCSDDGSIEIIEEYARNTSNIIPVYEKTNQHSKGKKILAEIIRHVKSKYIACCEGDDCWCDDNKLQRQYEYMEAHLDCSMCTHNTLTHDLSGQMPDQVFSDVEYVSFLSTYSIFNSWCVHTSSYFIRNNYDIRPQWSDSFWSGDYTILTIAHNTGKVAFIPGIMSVYNYNNPDGLTKNNMLNESKRIARVRERAKYLCNYLKYFSVDEETSSIINRRISAINEACATDELIYQIKERVHHAANGEDIALLIDYIVESVNDSAIRSEIVQPTMAAENDIAETRVTKLLNLILNVLSIVSDNQILVDAEGCMFLQDLLVVYGKNSRDPKDICSLIENPRNIIGWGSELSP